MTDITRSATSPPASRGKIEGELLCILFEAVSSPPNQVDSAALSQFKAAASLLESCELRILIFYSGTTLETRARLLEKMLSYRGENDDQPPLERSPGTGTGKDEEWICKQCPDPAQSNDGRKPFVNTFQRVANHLTSYHWKLNSWVCPICPHSYRLQDSLQRHKKERHKDPCQPNAQAKTTEVPIESQSQSQSQPHRIHGPQPQAVSRLDQNPPTPSPPGPDHFRHNFAPYPYPTSSYGNYGAMSTSHPYVAATAQQIQLAGLAQDVQANPLPVNQYSSAGAGYSQPGPSSAFASNNFDRPTSYSPPQAYPTSYIPENEIDRQGMQGFLAPGEERDRVGSAKEMLWDEYWNLLCHQGQSTAQVEFSELQ